MFELLVAGIYAYFAFTTFVVLLPSALNIPRLKVVLYAALWPVYWPVTHGPGEGMHIITKHAFSMFTQPVVAIVSVIAQAIDSMAGTISDTSRWLIAQIFLTARTLEPLWSLAVTAYFVIAIVIFPAMYLHWNWPNCSGLWDCSGTLLQALLWGLCWPAYYLAQTDFLT